MLIIARTDARAVEGLDAALERARRYRVAGADVLFVEAPESEAEVETVAATFGDTPLLYNWAEGGRSPAMSLERLRELGYRIVIFPVSTLLGATRAMQEVLAGIRATGTPAASTAQRMPFGEFLEFIGLPAVQELEARFASTDAAGD